MQRVERGKLLARRGLESRPRHRCDPGAEIYSAGAQESDGDDPAREPHFPELDPAIVHLVVIRKVDFGNQGSAPDVQLPVHIPADAAGQGDDVDHQIGGVAQALHERSLLRVMPRTLVGDGHRKDGERYRGIERHRVAVNQRNQSPVRRRSHVPQGTKEVEHRGHGAPPIQKRGQVVHHDADGAVITIRCPLAVHRTSGSRPRDIQTQDVGNLRKEPTEVLVQVLRQCQGVHPFCPACRRPARPRILLLRTGAHRQMFHAIAYVSALWILARRARPLGQHPEAVQEVERTAVQVPPQVPTQLLGHRPPMLERLGHAEQRDGPRPVVRRVRRAPRGCKAREASEEVVQHERAVGPQGVRDDDDVSRRQRRRDRHRLVEGREDHCRDCVVCLQGIRKGRRFLGAPQQLNGSFPTMDHGGHDGGPEGAGTIPPGSPARDTFLLLHAALMTLGFGVLLPLGAVLGMVRSKHHRTIQGIGVGVVAAGMVPTFFHSSDHVPPGPHQVFGWLLLALLACQVAAGLGLHTANAAHVAASARSAMLRVASAWHRAFGVAIFLFPYVQIQFGVIAMGRMCWSIPGYYLGQCIAHHIMGTAFVYYGAFTSLRYFGLLRVLKMPDDSYDSVVILAWGVVNSLTEHRWGQSWNHGDVQHTSMGIVWVGAGLLSVLVSFYLRSVPNVFPALVLGITGIAMALHFQHLPYSTMMHAFFGVSLILASLSRILSMYWDQERAGRGRLGILTSYLLIQSGVLFMGSNQEALEFFAGTGIVDPASYGMLLCAAAFLIQAWILLLIYIYVRWGPPKGDFGDAGRAPTPTEYSALEDGINGDAVGNVFGRDPVDDEGADESIPMEMQSDEARTLIGDRSHKASLSIDLDEDAATLHPKQANHVHLS
ncbi:hypothetical protein DFJ74DRAFT_466441 [Hyaloraphidium curvatum]|nr:hypothetical protein DFJ74DRAFT_466441 [Hyaloraphidium curvatum]